MNFIFKNKSVCHYCDAVFNKRELTICFDCKCLFCVNCMDNIKQQLFIKFAFAALNKLLLTA